MFLFIIFRHINSFGISLFLLNIDYSIPLIILKYDVLALTQVVNMLQFYHISCSEELHLTYQYKIIVNMSILFQNK